MFGLSYIIHNYTGLISFEHFVCNYWLVKFYKIGSRCQLFGHFFLLLVTKTNCAPVQYHARVLPLEKLYAEFTFRDNLTHKGGY